MKKQDIEKLKYICEREGFLIKDWIIDSNGGNAFTVEKEKLRAELLSVYGIGPETADSILL